MIYTCCNKLKFTNSQISIKLKAIYNVKINFKKANPNIKMRKTKKNKKSN